MYSKAITADSFITSPRFPVSVNLPFPLVFEVSINKISPPVLVQANPVTTPGMICSEYFLGSIPGPKSFKTFSLVITGLNFSSNAICFALFLISFAIFFSSPLTPLSLV